jgi:hypothetical protein
MQTKKRGEVGFVMSRGELMDFVECPSRWIRGYKSPGTEPQEWGSLMDALLLSPESFQERFSICPETYPDRKTGEPKPWNFNATFCQEWRDKQDGRQIVKPDDHNEANIACKSLLNSGVIARLIQSSDHQVYVTGTYQDSETGVSVPLRALIDIVPPSDHSEFGKSLADFKTCNTAEPRAWSKKVYQCAYDAQAALYLDLYNSASADSPRIDWFHVLQESFPPWQTGRRILSEEYINLGRHRYLSALTLYCQCLKENRWPDYDVQQPGRIVLNGWTLTDPEPWMLKP